MNLSQLYYFRKLSELQHYTKAAKELYITQPALSDAIRSLEKELGVPLFRKEGRNVKLTRYGKEFSVYVHDALRELDKGIAVMREYTGNLSGSLSIGGLYTITGDYLPALIRAYHEHYGDAVKIDVSQGFSLDLIRGLKEDKYDVIFAARKEDETSLRFEPIVAHQLVLGVRKGSPLATKKCVSLSDLRGYEVHTYRSGTPIGNEVEKVLNESGLAAHQDFDDEITMGGMLATARQDECALLTYTIGLKPFLDRIDIVPIDEREVPRDFHHVCMAYKKEEFQNRALESFIDFATKFPVPEDVVLRCGESMCDLLR
ncbi:MAG: LysR family transcriptional regulator [Slackia sp.]|nr:LysR family transcriptional regulator [Slackia sp.]